MNETKIATPDLSHLTSSDFNNIYEPAEDSFLMLDALELELNSIQLIKPAVCVEVGSGSGVVITALAKAIGPSSCSFIATDINPLATKATEQTADRNGVFLQVINCDLLCPLLTRLRGQVDILLFNPPYVPTEENEEFDATSQQIALSWAGGKKGRRVMDRLFPLISDLMSPCGLFYLLIVRENDEQDIKQLMLSYGWASSTILERRAGPEFLKVLKFNRISAVK